MRTLQEVPQQQSREVSAYRKIATDAVSQFCMPNPAIVGALLSGSAARGDARNGPFGFMIDLVVVAEDRNAIDLEEVFGPDKEPDIPFHCVRYEGAALQIELTTLEDLKSIRTRSEAEIFAKQEAVVLLDKNGRLEEWKRTAFIITPEEMRNRALMNFFRFQYLTDPYHQEKWTSREAWIQLAQNANEACECYCSFLYSINGWFIPRKDWLVYFTYDLKAKAAGHKQLIERSYRTDLTRKGVARRFESLQALSEWMKDYCRKQKWIA